MAAVLSLVWDGFVRARLRAAQGDGGKSTGKVEDNAAPAFKKVRVGETNTVSQTLPAAAESLHPSWQAKRQLALKMTS
eukprot:SAG31_NODE_22770_length_518_cov_0.861575_2_plen_77_part_01